MKVTDAQTETAAVAALTEQAARPMIMEAQGKPFLVLPEGWTRLDCELALPMRRKGEAALATVESLARYIALRDTGDTAIFTRREHFQVIAVFNPNTRDAPGWGDDRASVQFQVDSCLRRWKENAGKWLTQAAFGDFLRERGVDILSPDAATVLELVENLETHTTVKGKFARRAQDGSITILWEEDVQAQTRVPATFALRLPCFMQSETMFEVECRLNYRAKDGVLHWQFLIDEFDAAMDAAWDAEITKLREHDALPQPVRERIFAAF